MKVPIKNHIISYLQEKNTWVFGGTLEDALRLQTGHKASYVARECRELCEKGLLERQLVLVEGRRVVQYRYKQNSAPQTRVITPFLQKWQEEFSKPPVAEIKQNELF